MTNDETLGGRMEGFMAYVALSNNPDCHDPDVVEWLENCRRLCVAFHKWSHLCHLQERITSFEDVEAVSGRFSFLALPAPP